jgi:hypothetical protein
MRCHDAANEPVRRPAMDPTEDLQPPATFDQPGWKPRHRVDPMRPANPHIIVHRFEDPELEDLYQDFYKERIRGTRTGPDGHLIRGMVWAVIWLIIAAAVVYGAIEVGLWAVGSWTS